MSIFTAELPAIRFSGLYYAGIYGDLTRWKRAYFSQCTDEDPNEPMMQIIGAYATGQHYENVLLDFTTRQLDWVSCNLRLALANHALVLGQRLSEITPATVDAVFTYSAPLTGAATIQAGGRATTKPTAGNDAIIFEETQGVDLERTDQFAYIYEKDGSTYTDRTAAINAGTPVSPWGAAPQQDDALYFGMTATAFDGLDLTLTAFGDFWGAADHVWEYYDSEIPPDYPTAVYDPAGTGLTVGFDLTSILGATDRQGVEVTVKCLLTGYEETVASGFFGTNLAVVLNKMGQGTISLVATDYLVSVQWSEIPASIETSPDATTRRVEFGSTYTASRWWGLTEVNGTSVRWLRLRIVNATTTVPTITGADPTVGDQYLPLELSQGKTVTLDPLGTFTGAGGETFVGTYPNAIEGSVLVYVDETDGVDRLYENVLDFYSAASTSRQVALEFDYLSRPALTFGDGTKGVAPPLGSTAKLVYRIGADSDGNVGAGEIKIVGEKVGRYFRSVTNPRAASGWAPAQGSTADSLAEAKLEIPALMRTRQRAVTADDIVELVLAYRTAAGEQLVARCKAIYGLYGDDTMGVVCVGQAGNLLTADELDEIEAYLNPDEVEGTDGLMIMGLTAVARNYTRLTVDVTATTLGGDEDTIEAYLYEYLLPTSLADDGGWRFDFGDSVYRTKVEHLIFAADSDVENVVSLTDPAATLAGSSYSLPYPGTIAVTVT